MAWTIVSHAHRSEGSDRLPNIKDEPVETIYFDTDGQPVETEVMVTRVLSDSPAEKMGIKVGDVLIYYDGKPVKDFLHFIHQRSAEPSDGPAKELRIRRNGKILAFQILPGKMGTGLQGIGIHRTALSCVREMPVDGASQAVPSTPQPSH